ncbi:MAG TPA: hypothetical protein VN915_10015 [Elusimicrobiota bacterium]|nr:hypothetical protein [Elusimicrobiota bacterium]
MKTKLAFALTLMSLLFSSAGSGVAAAALSKTGKESAMTTKDLFQKVEALSKLKTFTPDSVSKALGTPLEFNDTSAESTGTEAHGQAGAAIESVEIGGEGLRFLTLSVSPSLTVTMHDIRNHFGEKFRIDRPVSHGPSQGPLYLVYALSGQELTFAVNLEKPNILREVILDRTEFALNHIKANSSSEKK